MKHILRYIFSFVILSVCFAGIPCGTVVYGQSDVDQEITASDQISTEAYSRGDYKTAIIEITKSISAVEKKYGADSAANAQRLSYLGMYQYYAGDYAGSLSSYQKALRLFGPDDDNNRLSIAIAEGGMASALHMTGKYDQALVSAARSLELYGRTVLPAAYKWCPGSVYYTIGMVYQYKGEYSKSDENLFKSKAIYDEVLGADHPYSATVVYAMGDNARLSGDHLTARKYFEKTRDIYVAAYGENHPYVGSAYYALAFEYYNDQEYSKAISCYFRACELYRNAYGEKHAFVAVSYFSLGRVFSAMGEDERAIAYLEKAKEIDYEVFGEEHINTIATLFGLAESLEKSGSYNEAFTIAEKTLALHRKVLGENHPESANVYLLIGKLYAARGKYSSAIESYLKGISITELRLGADHPTSGTAYPLLGFAYYMSGDTENAEKYIYRALDIAKRKSLPSLVIDSSRYLGYMKMKSGEYARAREFFNGIIDVIEHERSKTDAERSAVMESGVRYYYDSISASMKLGDVDAVFTTAESMKARAFLDRITLDAALSVDGVTQADRIRVTSLNERILSLIARRKEEIARKDGKIDEKLIASIGKDIESASNEFDRLNAGLMKNSEYRRLRKTQIASPAQAQELCDDETAILEYISDSEVKDSGNKPLCLVIRKKMKTIVSLDGDFDYDKAVKGFRESIIEPNRTRERTKLGNDLYDKLIAPLEAQLNGIKKIIIIPDGQLSFLPFDALRSTRMNEYLCERYEITLCPSVSVLLMTRTRKIAARSQGLIAFGGADYSDKKESSRGRRAGIKRTSGSELPPDAGIRFGESKSVSYYDLCGLSWENIPGTLNEVREIGDIPFLKKDVLIVTGKDVTESTVKRYSKEGILAKYRAVHFACHGYYDPEKVAYSSVVFSEVSGRTKTGEDGYLSVPEIAALRFSSDVVTLSACETGLGKFVRGDGVAGLARAFQEAGSARVNVTLWQVADVPTQRFMIALYKRMSAAKSSYSKAMSDTKKEFIHSKEYSDPYFWSSFVLYGD